MSLSVLRGVRIAALGALALTSSSFAFQSLPTPVGVNGYYVFVERTTAGDQIVGFNPDFGNGTAVTFPMLGALSNTHNRRSMQTPLEVLPTLAFDGLDPVPHVLVPTILTIGGFSTLSIESVHVASSVATSCSGGGLACPTTLVSGAGFVFDYDMLVVPGGGVFVEYSNGAATTVVQLGLAPGAAAFVTSANTFAQPPTPFATRMTYDPVTNAVVVPLLNGIGTLNATSGAFGTLQPTPAVPGAGGAQYVVGTNLAAGFNTPTGQTVVFGLNRPGGVSGHGYGYMNPATGAATFVGGDPFGATRSLAPGFTDPAVSVVGGQPVAVFSTASPSVVFGGPPINGVVGILTGGTTGVTVASTALRVGTTALGGLGNLELTRPTPTNVVSLFAIDASTNTEYVATVGLGGGTPIGSLAISAPLAAPGNLSATDRPWNMPGGSNYQVLDGAGSMLTYTITGGATAPTITLGATVGSLGLPTTTFNIHSGPSPLLGFGPAPVALLGLDGNAVTPSHGLFAGAPIAPAGFNVQYNDPFPYVALPTATFVWTPPLASSVATFGARTPAFNLTTAGGTLPAAAALMYPGGFAGLTLPVFLYFQGGYFGGSVFYVSTGSIVSEVVAF